MSARAITLAVGIAVLAAASAGVSRAGDPYTSREPVYGVMQASFGDCPDVEVPPAGTVCTDTLVIFFRGDFLEGGGAPLTKKLAPWHYFLESDTVSFTGAPEPDLVDVRIGFGELPEGAASSDDLKLSSASVNALLALDDGTNVTFTGTWTATTDRFTYGNDGPNGGVVHTGGRCLTVNIHAHQKFRYGRMTGTFAGQAVQSYPRADDSSAAIFNNRFRYIEVSHGGCG
jgi:hypothetical protein